MNKPYILALVLLLSLVCSEGCSDSGNTSCSEFKTLENTEWPYSRKLSFALELPDSINNGCLELVLRHTHGYRFSNIWLELTQTENDSTIATDTLNIRLADTFGHWLGSGSGASLCITDTIAAHTTLSRGTVLHLRHIMRPDTIAGVEQVGIVFSPDQYGNP